MDTLRTAVMFIICLTKINHLEALLWNSPKISSDLIRVSPNWFIERYQFQKLEFLPPKGDAHPYWNPEVTLVNTWVNSQEDNVFYMNCAFKKEGSRNVFMAILYVLDPTKEHKYKPIKNLEVAHCERNILNAVTIVPQKNKVSWIIYVNREKECTMDNFNMESKTYETADKCPPVGSKRGPQKNDGGYTNSWKETASLQGI